MFLKIKSLLWFFGTFCLNLIWLVLLYIAINNVDASQNCLYLWELTAILLVCVGLSCLSFWAQGIQTVCQYRADRPPYCCRFGYVVLFGTWLIGFIWSCVISIDLVKTKNDSCVQLYRDHYPWLFGLGIVVVSTSFGLPIATFVGLLLYYVIRICCCKKNRSGTSSHHDEANNELYV